MKTKTKISPVNTKRSWTKEEKATLKVLTKSGKSIDEMANALGRTRDSVAYQKNVLGYRSPGHSVTTKKTKSVIAKRTKGSVSRSSRKATTKDGAREMAGAARSIARANGKRITMAMFFVEDF